MSIVDNTEHRNDNEPYETHEPPIPEHRDAVARLVFELRKRAENQSGGVNEERSPRGSDKDLLVAVIMPGSGSRGHRASAVWSTARRLLNRQLVYVRFAGKPLFNGLFSSSIPDFVFINIDSQSSMLAILGHELLHDIKRTHPDLYADLSDRLDAVIANDGRYATELIKAYKDAGLSLKGLDAREELEADIVGENFMDPEFWKSIAKSTDKPDIFRRAIDAVVKWLDYVIQKLGKQNLFGIEDFVSDAVAARSAVIQALDQFSVRETAGATRLATGTTGTADGVSDIPLQDLQTLADRLKAKMPNMPKVNVLADPSEAPYGLIEYINRQDAWYDVQGAMHEGEFYLFRSGLQSLEQAEHVLAEHEAAHFGLRAVLGKDGLKSAMQMVWVHNASVRQQASKLQEGGSLSDAEATEEVLVDIPTKDLVQLKGWRKVMLKVRDFLDRRGYEKLADRLTTWLNDSLDEQQRADWFVADLVGAARDYVAGKRDGAPSGYVGATRLSRLKESAASASVPTALSRADGGKAFNEGSATVIGTFKNDIPMKAHQDYKAAKGGDLMAAAALVQDLVKPEDLQSAHEKFGSDVVFVPVHAEEAAGRNQIPNALAMMYAANSGAEVDTSIAQANRAFHTGAGAMERLLARAEFSGYVESGRRYVLVDDVTTMGSTLADLAAYIQSRGGDVAGSVVLVNAMRGGKIQADRKTINQLEARHGEVIRELFGFGPQQLTAAEAQYLIGFRSADELRTRVVTAKQARVDRLASKNIPQRADSPSSDSRLSRSSPEAPAPTTVAERADKLIGKPVGRALR